MSRPLRILHILNASEAGGLTRYVFNLCTALHAQGHEIAVAGDRGASHFLFEQAPWPWIDLPLKRRVPVIWPFTRRLHRLLAEWPVDVMHTHYRRATLLARSLQRRHAAPILYTVHLSHMSLRGMNRWLTDFGDLTHAPSLGARDWLINDAGLAPERVALVPHGIDIHRFHPPTPEQRYAARAALSLGPDDLAATYAGRFDDPKNLDWLLDLAAATRERLPHLRLILIGQGPHRHRLHGRIEKENLQGRVRMLNYGDPLPIYHAADAFLLASWREGFNLACAEAMSCGLPALRTRTSGAADLIVENQTGRSCAIDHDTFLTAATEFLSLPRSQLAEMGEAASAHVRAHFAFDTQVAKTIELYRGIQPQRH